MRPHLVKDDEKFASTSYSKFLDRVRSASKALDKIYNETGRTALYAVNVTGRLCELKKRILAVINEGLNAILISYITLGFSVLRFIAEDKDIQVPIFAHRVMHGVLSRYSDHGIDFGVLVKLARLAGADIVQIGSIRGEHVETKIDIVRRIAILFQKLSNIKKSLPAITSGITPKTIPYNLNRINTTDVIFILGRGAYFDAGRVATGVKAALQAIDVAIKGISFKNLPKNTTHSKRH